MSEATQKNTTPAATVSSADQKALIAYVRPRGFALGAKWIAEHVKSKFGHAILEDLTVAQLQAVREMIDRAGPPGA